MKILWVEDHQPVCELLAVAADKAARARVPVDLVIATTLMEAESRLRLERFDLVMLDLTLPDSHDGDMTIARIANMGKHRIAICSARADRNDAVETALRCGCNIAPEAVFKANLPFHRFIQRAETFHDFLLEQMPGGEVKVQAAA